MIPIMILLTQIPPAFCNSHWPTDTDGTQRVSAPSNLVIWSENAPSLRDEMGNTANVVDLGGETVSYNGVTWKPFAVEAGWENTCLFRSDAEDFGSVCVGDTLDDEAPIDPVLSGELGLPSFGEPSINGTECSGSFQGGNLRFTIEADETGPLLAHVVVKDGDTVLADEVQPMSGQLELSMDVGNASTIDLEVRFIDQAGQFGELATISFTAPPGGCQNCSHSGFSLFMLAAVGALRRRRRR